MFPRFCHFLGFSPKSLFLEISGDNSFSKIFTSREVDDILKIVCSFSSIVNLFCWVPLMRSIGFCDFVFRVSNFLNRSFIYCCSDPGKRLNPNGIIVEVTSLSTQIVFVILIFENQRRTYLTSLRGDDCIYFSN